MFSAQTVLLRVIIIMIIIDTFLKRLIPLLATYMRLKAQYMFSKNQANKETSDIKKRSGMGR